jgi:hypothetical protein
MFIRQRSLLDGVAGLEAFPAHIYVTTSRRAVTLLDATNGSVTDGMDIT